MRWSKRERALLYNYKSNSAKALGGILSGILERITLGEMNGDLCGEECKRNGISARIRNGDRLRGVPPDPSMLIRLSPKEHQ